MSARISSRVRRWPQCISAKSEHEWRPSFSRDCAAERGPALRCASRLNEEQLGFLQSSPPLRIVQACFRATEREDCHDPPDIAAHPARQPRRGRSARSSPRSSAPRVRSCSARGRELTEKVFGEALPPVRVVERICEDVRKRGREAVFHYTEQLDRVRLDADTLRVDNARNGPGPRGRGARLSGDGAPRAAEHPVVSAGPAAPHARR